MRTTTCIVAILMSTGAISTHAAIGDSIDQLRRSYGQEIEISTYRPDLYATSYDFRKDRVKIHATILPDRASKIDVFFDEMPAEDELALLERYSGAKGWRRGSTSDLGFARHFPLFDRERNQFFVADGLAAMVQRGMGGFALVLWIQSDAYPDLLRAYREKQKANKPLHGTSATSPSPSTEPESRRP